ncbi:MAG: hypothetical protein H5T49_03260 [Hadesarchaea archaeon]|nr:hypothetical protein [Hadesarchaea archaeon]
MRTRKRACGNLRARVGSFFACLEGKIFGKRAQLGLFGLDAGLTIAFIIAIMTGAAIALTKGLPAIFKAIADGLDFAPLLIHIPGIAGQPFFNETMSSALLPAGPVGIFSVSTVMGELFGKFQLIALAGFIVAVIIMGITYASEQFNLVSKGTAFQLLTESGFVLILLFIFPIIFNGAAVVVNGLNQQVILRAAGKTPTDIIKEVAYASTVFGMSDWTPFFPFVNIGDAIMAIIMSTATFAAMFSVFVTGVMRLILLAVVAGAFPLILILRLIPPLRGIASNLQGTLIGLIVASILISIVFRVSWGVVSGGGLGTIMMWAVGCGTLITASFLTFSLTTGFGGLGKMIFGGMVGPASAIAGGAIAAGGGLAIGAGLGTAGAGATALRGVGEFGLRAATSEVLRGTVSGAAVGARAGPVGAIFAAPGAGKEAALTAQSKHFLEGVERMEGTPPFGTFLEDFASPEHRNALSNVERSDLHWAQEKTAGEVIARELNEGRLNEDMLQKMYVEAKFHPKSKSKFNHYLNVVKRSGIGRQQLENALKAAYADIKSDPTYGEDHANLWLRSLHNRALGRNAFDRLGQGMVLGSQVVGIEGGG